jgi:hypothetical protein
MYGVPEDLDLAPFIGSTLDQIGLGAYQISFRFSGPRGLGSPRLDVEGRWAIHGADGALIDQASRDEKPSDRESYRVHRLLGHTVVASALDPPRSLTLTFDDGATLIIWDDSDQFESFHVAPGGYHI